MIGKTLQQLMQSDPKPAVAISILEGPGHRGHLLSLGVSAEDMAMQPGDFKALQLDCPTLSSASIAFQAIGETAPLHIDWNSVKAIQFVRNLEAAADSEENVRFFDSAAIPPYLWVRVEFTDGEVVEGKLDNSLSLMNGPCLVLYPLDETANQQCICIPRGSIANLQVITFRR